MANSPGVAELLAFDANDSRHWDFLLQMAAKSRAQKLLDGITAASHPHKDSDGQSAIHDRIHTVMLVGYPSRQVENADLNEVDFAANRQLFKSMFGKQKKE